MLKRVSGQPRVEWAPKTASTVLYNGSPVISTSGYITIAVANGNAIASTALKGVIMRDVKAADADYANASATNTKVPIDIPMPDEVWEADVKPGVTPTVALVNTFCDFFIGDGSTGTAGECYLDTGTNSRHHALIIGMISTTKVLFKFNQASLLNSQAVA